MLSGVQADAQVNVTQEHNNPSRDGVYVDAAFTPSAAANLTRDLNFNGTISGNVYAQPLYIEGGPNGPVVIAVTESNNVYALNATTGTVIWQRNLGAPVPLSVLGCGNIDPVGITSTPVVDLASRALFLDAFTTPDGGTTKKHLIFSLNVDTGATNPGWPVDVNTAAHYNSITFNSAVQEDRGALALVGGRVYVAYSAYVGDCGNYHGWVVGVAINSPSNVMAGRQRPSAVEFGDMAALPVMAPTCLWSPATRSTQAVTGWAAKQSSGCRPGRLGPASPTDYWAPTNWLSLDNSDTDLGGVSATVIDVPGATPSQLGACARQRSQRVPPKSEQSWRDYCARGPGKCLGHHAKRHIGCHVPHQPGNVFCFPRRRQRSYSLQDHRNKPAGHCECMEHGSGRARLAMGNNH